MGFFYCSLEAVGFPLTALEFVFGCDLLERRLVFSIVRANLLFGLRWLCNCIEDSIGSGLKGLQPCHGSRLGLFRVKSDSVSNRERYAHGEQLAQPLALFLVNTNHLIVETMQGP